MAHESGCIRPGIARMGARSGRNVAAVLRFTFESTRLSYASEPVLCARRSSIPLPCRRKCRLSAAEVPPISRSRAPHTPTTDVPLLWPTLSPALANALAPTPTPKLDGFGHAWPSWGQGWPKLAKSGQVCSGPRPSGAATVRATWRRLGTSDPFVWWSALAALSASRVGGRENGSEARPSHRRGSRGKLFWFPELHREGPCAAQGLDLLERFALHPRLDAPKQQHLGAEQRDLGHQDVVELDAEHPVGSAVLQDDRGEEEGISDQEEGEPQATSRGVHKMSLMGVVRGRPTVRSTGFRKGTHGSDSDDIPSLWAPSFAPGPRKSTPRPKSEPEAQRIVQIRALGALLRTSCRP